MRPSIHGPFQAVCSTGISDGDGDPVALERLCLSLRSRPKKPAGYRVRSNVFWIPASNGRRFLARIKSNLNTKGSWGRGVQSLRLSAQVPVPPSCRDFFSGL
jgi:hypothetical protein